MSSKLSASVLLKKKANSDENYKRSLYYAYYWKRGYGNGIEELPLDDTESLFTTMNSNISNINQLSNSETQEEYNRNR